MADLRHLADPELQGRATGSPGGLAARAWLIGKFAAIGLAPAGSDGYLQRFRVTRRHVRWAPFLGSTSRDAANIIGRLDGSLTRAIVVSAHYDHLGMEGGRVHPGADDNASGVAAMLAAARVLRELPRRHALLFVAFDAEELALRGARAFVGSALAPAGSIALNVNLDMVARSEAREIYAAGAFHTPALEPVLRDVQGRARVRLLLGHDRPIRKGEGPEDWTWLSDHGAFHDAGIPFVYFGVEDHADYHQPTDTVEKIDPSFFGDVADTIVETLVRLDGQDW